MRAAEEETSVERTRIGAKRNQGGTSVTRGRTGAKKGEKEIKGTQPWSTARERETVQEETGDKYAEV